MPTAGAGIVKVATFAVTAPEPSGVVPSRKVTIPVGEAAGTVKVAVKVSGLLVKTGLADEVSAMRGVTMVTVRETDVEDVE
jgi:hypothetical protein